MTPYVPPTPGPMNRVTALGKIAGTHTTASGQMLRVQVPDDAGELRWVAAEECGL